MDLVLTAKRLRALEQQFRASLRQDTNIPFRLTNDINGIRNDLIQQGGPEISDIVRKSTTALETSKGEPPYPSRPDVAVHLAVQLLDIVEHFRSRAETLPDKTQQEAKAAGRREIKLQMTSRAYVNPDRIDALKNVQNLDFDVRKLVRLCEELNINFAAECYLGMAMLQRAIIDHVPPVFGYKNFDQVASNVSGGRTFKTLMTDLNSNMRKIADLHLHTQMRKADILPNVTQIDFSNALDLLLAEVAAKLEGKDSATEAVAEAPSAA